MSAHAFVRNMLAVVAATALLSATLIANGAEPAPAPAPTRTAQSCPRGSAIAQRVTFDTDGTIHIITRCVAVAK